MGSDAGIVHTQRHTNTNTHTQKEIIGRIMKCKELRCTCVLFVSCMYLDGGMGGGGWLLTSLFLFYSWASML